jgi:hypothetical protein
VLAVTLRDLDMLGLSASSVDWELDVPEQPATINVAAS